jgi:hypothetical protein
MGRGHLTNAQRVLKNDAAALHRDNVRHQREAMTAADVEKAMRSIIAGKLERDGGEAVITLADFQQANLPMDKVTPIARRVLTSVQNEMAEARS